MIPIFDAKRLDKKISQEIREAINGVIKKGIFILGEKVSEFEEDWVSYLGVRYAVGVASGTDALSLAMLAAGVKARDEVIMPANSYPTVFAVTAIGARPVLVDVEEDTFNINPDKIEQAISKKTKAVIAVHLYGQAADLERIIPIVKKYKLKLIEDCAQAHGAEVSWKKRWRKVGTVGDVGCFSFYPTKNLGCCGDGGMVVTNREEIYKKIKLLRMYGEEKRYESVALGRNSRLDELQAAILLVKMKYLDKWNKRRRVIAKQYVSRLRQGYGGQARIKIPIESEYARHVYHLYVVRSKKRDKLKEYLESKGIQTGIHYPKPIHRQPSFKYLGYKEGDFPVSEKISREVLSLPMFPELEDKEVEYIAREINNFQ